MRFTSRCSRHWHFVTFDSAAPVDDGLSLEDPFAAPLARHDRTANRRRHRAGYPSLLVLSWLGLSGISAASAQAQTVSGTVTSSDTRQALPAVSVTVKGKSQSTASNSAGRYTLNVSSLQDTLLFSRLGHQAQEVPIEGRTTIDVQLAVQAIEIEGLVVTGYRVQERATVTGSVTTVNSREFEDVPVDNLSNALAGRLSGVTISQNAGTPGRESSIRVRAAGTFNNASPLYVIDGVVSDDEAFNALSSEEVESVSILKDGAAASVYGSRAANGVILVTTRRGRMGVREFTYRGSVGTQEPTRIPQSLNAYEHAKAINDAWSYNGIPRTDARYYTEDELEYFRNNSWNWLDALWRDPVTTQHSLSMTGGTDGVRYYLSGSFLDETGSFDNLSYQRLTSRANIDVDVTERLKASVDFSTSRRDRHGPSWGGNDWGHEDLYKALSLRTRMVPPYINGMAVGNWVEWHPGSVISNEAGYDKRDWSQYNAKLRLDYQVPFIPGVSANLSYHKGHVEGNRKQFNLPYQMALFNTTGTNNHIVGDQHVGWRDRVQPEFLQQTDSVQNDYQLNAQVNYRGTFGGHTVDGFLVYEQAEYDRVQFNGRRDSFISPVIDQFIGGSSDPANQTASGWQRKGARISYVGLLSYNYASKYFLQGTFRYDGSIIFAPENRWGFFPSISAGWRVTEEPFFKVGFLNDLKLRASYGEVGNDDVGSFQWLQKYEIENGAIFDAPTTGITPGRLSNRDITWEKSRSYNVGMDTRFWGNRMSLTVDVFRRNTYDILGSRGQAVPSTFGASLPDENYQEVNTRGFEVELGYTGRFGASAAPFEYYLSGNLGYATNEIVRLNEAENIRPYQSRIGRTTTPASTCFGYIATGILRTQADLDALPAGYTIIGLAPKLGMLNYQDLRGPTSDEPDGRITGDDQSWICDYTNISPTNNPPMTYGLTIGGSWRALSLNALFQGAAGHKHLMHDNGRDLQARAEESSYRYWADSWTPDNPNGAYPGYRATTFRTRYPVSTFWLRDASFLRLKSVTLSYDLPERITSPFGADNARLYFAGTNLFLLQENFGDWGFDPEMNNIRSYPLMRTFSAGMNVSLRKR